MFKPNNTPKLTLITGVKEIDDITAAKCSGGYIIKLYSEKDGKNFNGYRRNITGDSSKRDFFDRDRLIAQSIGIVGEPGATYKLSYGLNAPGLPTIEKTLTSEGWSNNDEVFENLDAPQGFTGFSIDRIS